MDIRTTIWKVVNPRCETSVQSGIHALEHTLEDVRAWMFSNKLCLNDSITECIVFAQKRHINPPPPT